MTRITLTDDRSGLPDFPADFTPVGRDGYGDVIAVDGKGKVFSFAHGRGDWNDKSPAFVSMAQLERYVAFQDQLDVSHDEGLEALKQRKLALQAFAKEMRGSAYAREEVSAALETVKDAIADLRWSTSKAGRALAHRKEVSSVCENALRAAGVVGNWIVRPHVDLDHAICVVGPFDGEWTEARVLAMLQPMAGKLEVTCRRWPGKA